MQWQNNFISVKQIPEEMNMIEFFGDLLWPAMKWFLFITARLLSGDGEHKVFILPDCATHLPIIKETEQNFGFLILGVLFMPSAFWQ